jgi:hypothetical protein
MSFHRHPGLDGLSHEKAMDLLLRLNEEVYTPDQFPDAEPAIRTGNSILCSTDEHVNLSERKFTPSLSVKQGESYPVGVRCFGSCNHGAPGASGLSDYLRKVGPVLEADPGRGLHAAEYYFFQHEGGQINRVLSEMEAGTFTLGYLDWRRERGLASAGAGKSKSYQVKERASASQKYTIDDLLAECTHLGQVDRGALEMLCAARKWNPEIVTRVAHEGRLGVESTRGSDGRPDVRLTFAVSGLLPAPFGARARAVKGRLLNDKNIMWIVKPSGTRTPLLTNFTAMGKRAPSLAVYLCEGEPDAISLRHLYPDAAILAVCGLSNYSTHEVLDVVPRLGLGGHHVVLCLDRDRRKGTEGEETWIQVHRNAAGKRCTDYDALITAILTHHPTLLSLSAWMPPPDAGKDVNDWLKSARGGFRRADGRLIYRAGQGELAPAERAARMIEIMDSYLSEGK